MLIRIWASCLLVMCAVKSDSAADMERCQELRGYVCKNGGCASPYSQCDGVTDCTDASDESFSICPNGTDPYFDSDYVVFLGGIWGQLYEVQIVTSNVRKLPNIALNTTAEQFTTLDIDQYTRDIYVAALNEYSIKVIKWATKNVKVFKNITGGFVSGVMVDDYVRVLYYADYVERIIYEVSLNTGEETVILNNVEARALAYDKLDRKIYWIQANSTSSAIFKSSVVNTIQVSTVLSNIEGEILGFDMDPSDQKLYWTRRPFVTDMLILESSDLSGLNRVVLASDLWSQGYTLTVTKNHIFIDHQHVPTSGFVLAGFEKKSRDLHLYRGQDFVTIFQSANHAEGSDVCMADYIHCAGAGCVYNYHVCDGHKDCVDGSDEMEPLCNGTKALLIDNYLVVSDFAHSTFYQVDPTSGEVIHISEVNGVPQGYRPFSIVLHPETGDIYATTDNEENCVVHISMSTKERTVVYHIPDWVYFSSLALDTERNLLYRSLVGADGYIEEINLIDGQVIRRVKNITGTHDLVWFGMQLDQELRILYWMGAYNNTTGIYSIDLNKPSSESILVVSTYPYNGAFTADFKNREIFWSSYTDGEIWKADINGTGQQLIYTDTEDRKYLSMTCDNDFLYLIEEQRSHIRRLNRATFEMKDFSDQRFATLTSIAFFKPRSDATTKRQSSSTNPVQTEITNKASTGITNSAPTGITTSVPNGKTSSVPTEITNSALTGITTSVSTGITSSVPIGITTSVPIGITTSALTGIATSVPIGITTSVSTGITSSVLTGPTNKEPTGATKQATTGATNPVQSGSTTPVRSAAEKAVMSFTIYIILVICHVLSSLLK